MTTCLQAYIDRLRPNTIIRGSLLPEPVQVITAIPIGDSLKLIGTGSRTRQTYQQIFSMAQLATLDFCPASKPLNIEANHLQPGGEALRILLAEDHVINQKLALRLLQRLGYRADLVTNGLEVIEALKRQPYDVVLMDVEMPELDGLAAARQIRQKWPGQAGPYIIALTANAMQEDRVACLEAGMDDYVSKPLQVNKLVAALNKVQSAPPPPKQIEPTRTQSSRETKDSLTGPITVVYPKTAIRQPSIEASLDPAALESLLEVIGGEQVLLAQLIDSFLEDAPPLLARMRQALAQADTAKLRYTAHTIKSSANDFGATGLAEWCQSLEDMSKAGELEEAAKLIAQIDKAFEQVEALLRTMRNRLSRSGNETCHDNQAIFWS